MFENSVKEAKTLPSFAGTDDYEVRLTLNGAVLDQNMPRLIDRIGAETLESFSTQDFLILNSLSRETKIPRELQGGLKRPIELGLVQRVARGKVYFVPALLLLGR